MNDTDLSRTCATRLRAICAMVTALVAMLTLAAAPALAAIRHHIPLCHDSHARIGHVPQRAIERATVCLLDHQRTMRGLPRLRSSRLLVHSAQSWTDTMVRHRAFSHGTDFAARISAAGFDWSRVGENIADGYRTASGAVIAWMASLGHCENILDPDFREVGVGFAHGSALGGGSLRGTWTLDFALGIHQRSRSANWRPAEGCPYSR